ncbi:MAG TPA: transcription elongation factor GreA [Candidatus Magasanikbacteria bacterium]|nr:transcription elongation factor GreA [Candidatus Magasanikbacteria bacterium]
MMMEDTQYMSQDKLDQLKAEYSDLKLEKISAIAKRIDEARQLGDLSENAEYHAARDEMAWAQSRVKELEHIIDSAEIVANTGSKIIQIGSSIRVKANKVEKEYTIVGAQEANPLAGKISNESPIGSAFLGKSKGDKVQVRLPAGVQEYKILDVK